MGGATHAGTVEAAARLEPFAGRQREHRPCELCLELAEDRLAPAGGNAPCHAADGAADGVAFAAGRDDLGLHGCRSSEIGAAHSGAIDLCAGYAMWVDAAGDVRDAAHPGDDLHAELLAEELLRDGPSNNPCNRLAGARASAAARVAVAELGLVGEVGVRWAVEVAQRLVVLALGILVGHLEGDRRARGAALEETRAEEQGVCLAPRGGEGALACAPACELCRNRRLIERQTGGAAVDDAADGRPVRLAPGGEPKEGPEAVHDSLPGAHGEGRGSKKVTSRPRGS